MVKENTYRLVTTGVIIGACLLFAIVVFSGGFGARSERAARAAAVHFGTQMQNVSLLSPDASSTLASTYGPLVTPELLALWQADPESAPGRLTSSPYPERIETVSINKQGSGYIVSGTIIHMTSSGEAGRTPVILLLIPHEKLWLVAAYQEQTSAEE